MSATESAARASQSESSYFRHRKFCAAAILTALAALPCGAQEPSHALADGARDKIDAIVANGEGGRRGAGSPPLRTALTEAEINSYFAVHGPDILPPSVTRPEVRIGSEGRIRARATVDLNAVRRSRPQGWRDPLAYVAGSVEIVATGTVAADGGMGRAELESATVSGVSVPASVVRELVQFFTSSEERPHGIDLERPFELPAEIRRVIVERGRVTVVQ